LEVRDHVDELGRVTGAAGLPNGPPEKIQIHPVLFQGDSHKGWLVCAESLQGPKVRGEAHENGIT